MVRCKFDLRVGAIIIFILLGILFLEDVEGKLRKSKQKKPSNETNVFNFLRIFIMRLVYGFASMIGADEALEDFMGGAFVPPGVEDADYRDYLDDDDKESDDYY